MWPNIHAFEILSRIELQELHGSWGELNISWFAVLDFMSQTGTFKVYFLLLFNGFN